MTANACSLGKKNGRCRSIAHLTRVRMEGIDLIHRYEVILPHEPFASIRAN